MSIDKYFLLFVLVVLSEIFIYFIKPDLPKFPGDIYLEKFGFRIYIPLVSALLILAAIYFLSGFFKI